MFPFQYQLKVATTAFFVSKQPRMKRLTTHSVRHCPCPLTMDNGPEWPFASWVFPHPTHSCRRFEHRHRRDRHSDVRQRARILSLERRCALADERAVIDQDASGVRVHASTPLYR